MNINKYEYKRLKYGQGQYKSIGDTDKTTRALRPNEGPVWVPLSPRSSLNHALPQPALEHTK